MADTKISALTAATTPLAGTEVLPIVQSGVTKQVSIANLTAGRAVSADSLTLTGSPLPATSGGTGQSSYAVGDLLYASTTTVLSKLADVATGNALISGGVGVAPFWGKIGLTTHVSGVLPTANGGTNLSSFTANGIVYASSTSALATGSAFTFDGTNVALSLSQNAATKFTLTNSNGGTSASVRYQASNGSNIAEFGIRGTAETTNGVLAAQVGFLYSPSAAGAAVVAAAGPLYFAAGGTAEGAKLDTNNNFTIGTTTAYTNAAFTSLNVGGSKSGKVGLIGLFNASDTLQATLDTYNNTFRIGTNGTSNPIAFYLGGSVTNTMQLHSSTGVSIGNTTDPGAGNLSVTGTIKSATSGAGGLFRNDSWQKSFTAASASLFTLRFEAEAAAFVDIAIAGTITAVGGVGQITRYAINEVNGVGATVTQISTNGTATISTSVSTSGGYTTVTFNAAGNALFAATLQVMVVITAASALGAGGFDTVVYTRS